MRDSVAASDVVVPARCRFDASAAKCVAAALLLALWLASQTIQFTFVPVYANLSLAAANDEGGYLLLAAMWLVLNNWLRVSCLYGGWFLLAAGLSGIFDSKRIAWLLPLVAIPVSYLGPAMLHFPSIPHFGVPALIALASVLLLQHISRDVTRAWYKLSVQAAAIFSIQWLDVVPALTRYGFGWGELSVALKEIAALMERDYLLNTICGLAFCASASSALLLARLFVSYEKQIRQLRLLRERERELMHARTVQSRMRLYQEMQYLVHDLKRPLTTILGLADLLAVSRDERTSRHGMAILDAAERMDQMIDELKDPDSTRLATTDEIVNYTMAQIRVLPWGPLVEITVEEGAGNARLMMNVIRFSRVLANLLDNAQHASSQAKSPYIALRAERAGGGVLFSVEDNGPGFAEVAGARRSTWGSSGLGLAFVREALASVGGKLSYESRDGGGTVVRVWAPEANGKETNEE